MKASLLWYSCWIVRSRDFNLTHSPSPTEIAWAAGLFEGEGCINEQPEGYGLQLLMTDEDVVRRFSVICETGTIYPRKPKPENHRVVHVWRTRQATEVDRLLRLFLPYLGERRREKADHVLAAIAARYNRECLTCGTAFFANRFQKKFCSRDCMKRGMLVRNQAWREANPEYQREWRQRRAKSAQRAA